MIRVPDDEIWNPMTNRIADVIIFVVVPPTGRSERTRYVCFLESDL